MDSMEVGTGNGTKALFYFPSKIISSYDDEQKVVSKMRRMVAHLDKHSHPKVTGILARHLHALVKNELRAQGFKILFERGAKYHGSRGRTGAGHKVDLRAEHLQKKIAVGVMVRNELDLMDRAELDTILESCRELDVTPILACRWLAPYREEINKSGFLWQFRAQLYPLGFEALAETMRKKFRFPSMVATEIPARPAREFEAWLAGINGT